MAGGGSGDQVRLEFTPTWIVALICFGVVMLSLLVERLFHYLGTLLQRKKQKALFQALEKLKSELMVLGCISLLLVVFQGLIQKICIPVGIIKHMLPCKYSDEEAAMAFSSVKHVTGRRLLLSSGSSSTCKKGKVPVLSIEAIHEMHLFIFVMALTHVVRSALTFFLRGLKMRVWKKWEDSILKSVTIYVSPSGETVCAISPDVPRVIPQNSPISSWLHAFLKQFYGSVTKSDYTTMRHYFIMTHCGGNQKFDFHKYIVRALESDFEKVVGISWYMWICVVFFLFINVYGLHAYFWISFLPLILLLTVGTKLEHIITQSANDIAEQQSAIEGGLSVNSPDDHFWFGRPRLMLFAIHYILFQNAFEIAIFFWTLTTYGFGSCIMGKIGFLITRLVISVITQILCSYSTLPLYAFVALMGSSLKGIIFEENIQESLGGWALNPKKRKSRKICDEDSIEEAAESENLPSTGMNVVARRTSLMELIRKRKDSLDSIQSITEPEIVSATGESMVGHKDFQTGNCEQTTLEVGNVSSTVENMVAHKEERKAQDIKKGDHN